MGMSIGVTLVGEEHTAGRRLPAVPPSPSRIVADVIVVATLRTHDQADIVDASVSFHLAMGAAVVIATDHRSSDGTRDILRAYEREGVLVLIEEDGPEIKGSEWRTRAARLAKAEYGADWVFSADGDEFWWPRGGTYPEVLAHVPARYGIVSAPVRPFYPRPDDGRPFHERMTARCSTRFPLNDPTSPYRPARKILHRGDETVVVQRGNHSLVGGPGFETDPTWSPVEVLHFPIRSERQHEQKSTAWLEHYGTSSWGKDSTRERRVASLRERGALSDFYDSITLSDPALHHGLEDGTIEIDTRLRDVLRRLARRVRPRLSAASACRGSSSRPSPSRRRRPPRTRPTRRISRYSQRQSWCG